MEVIARSTNNPAVFLGCSLVNGPFSGRHPSTSKKFLLVSIPLIIWFFGVANVTFILDLCLIWASFLSNDSETVHGSGPNFSFSPDSNEEDSNSGDLTAVSKQNTLCHQVQMIYTLAVYR